VSAGFSECRARAPEPKKGFCGASRTAIGSGTSGVVGAGGERVGIGYQGGEGPGAHEARKLGRPDGSQLVSAVGDDRPAGGAAEVRQGRAPEVDEVLEHEVHVPHPLNMTSSPASARADPASATVRLR
jgi:hypothetical protein